MILAFGILFGTEVRAMHLQHPLSTKISPVTMAWLIMAIVCDFLAVPASAVTIPDIERAWRDRAARFQSVQIKWHESRFIPMGGIRGIEQSPFGGSTTSVPPEDVRHEYDAKLTIHGAMLRYETTEPVWNGSLNQFAPLEITSAFDGTTGTQLTRFTTAPRFPLKGHIADSPRLMTMLSATKPVLYAFSPQSDAMEGLRHYIVTPRPRALDESTCTVLLDTRSQGALRRTLWVDAARNFVVRRWQSTLGSTVLSQTDVYYEHDPLRGQLPKKWKSVEYSGGGLITRAVEAQVTEAIFDVPVDLARFRIEFPTGTIVIGQMPDGAETKSYVRTDGSMRPVTREELLRRVSADELERTNPGEAGLDRDQTVLWMWALTIVLFAIACASALWMWRRWESKTA